MMEKETIIHGSLTVTIPIGLELVIIDQELQVDGVFTKKSFSD